MLQLNNSSFSSQSKATSAEVDLVSILWLYHKQVHIVLILPPSKDDAVFSSTAPTLSGSVA